MKKYTALLLSTLLLTGCISDHNELAQVSNTNDTKKPSNFGEYFGYTDENYIGNSMTLIGNVVSGFTCAGVFVAGRDVDEYIKVDSAIFAAIDLGNMDITVDREAKTVNVKLFGLDISTSVYREGLGCTNIFEGYSADRLKQDTARLPEKISDETAKQLWPTGERVDIGLHRPTIDYAALNTALDFAFEPAKDGEVDPLTRAVVVVYKGRIVAERYASGFASDSLLYGASMSKSVTNALVGIRVKDKKLDLTRNHLLPEWSGENDPRSKINLDHLLRMSSGLEFRGRHATVDADGNLLLFMSPDMGGFAASRSLEFPIDTQHKYTCGTTNIISKIIRNTFEGDDQTYWNFPRDRLFDKLGMRHTLFQTDASGTFVGSSYVWASARDFARLGLLYVQNGKWNGEDIWNPNWVEYSTTPSTTLLNGHPRRKDGTNNPNRYGAYGAQIQIIPPFFEDKPAEHYRMGGWGDQTVEMIPKKQLVIVRMGMTKPGSNAWDRTKFSNLVQRAFPETSSKD